MGIEKFKKGSAPKNKDAMKDATPAKRKELKKKLKLSEAKEAKEKEVTKARGLCSDYHKKLDKTGYFNSKSMRIAKELLPKFLKLKTKLLPESVQMVIRQRIAYLQLMTALGKRKSLKMFMDKFSPKITDAGMLSTNRNDLEKKAKESKEFKNLKENDFLKAIKAMKASKLMLKPLLAAKGDFGKNARIYLMPANVTVKDSRIDDSKAAKNLHNGLDQMIKNLSFLRRKKEVLKQA